MSHWSLVAASLTAARALEALAVNAALGGLAFGLRTVSASGFAAGVVVGTVIYVAVGPAGFALLALFFMAGSAVTKIGLKRKRALDAAQAGGGARSAKHVIGKGLIPAACAVLAWYLERPDWALVAFVAALAAGLGDTVATELGTLLGRRHWVLPRFRRVAAGTPGAISLEGTAFGCVSAAVVAAAAAAAELVPWQALWMVVLAALVAGLDESLTRRHFADCIPARWRGPMLNLDLTFTAAAMAGLLWWLTSGT